MVSSRQIHSPGMFFSLFFIYLCGCVCVYMYAHIPTLKGILVICTLMTDCWRALTFTPSSTILIRVLQFVPPHLVRKLLQSSSNPPSKSRHHELMKPQKKRERCVFGGALMQSVSFLSLFLLSFFYDCCSDLSCLILCKFHLCLSWVLFNGPVFFSWMVDRSLSLNITTLKNVHGLISYLSSTWYEQLRTHLFLGYIHTKVNTFENVLILSFKGCFFSFFSSQLHKNCNS